MGKEWLYWGGGGGGRSTKKGKGDKNSSPSGCMCAVFQLFDNLPLFQFTVSHCHSSFASAYLPPQLPDEPNIVFKGIEAPRNSLESEGALMKVTSSASSSTTKQQHSLSLPMCIQIKTSSANSKPRTDDLSSDCSSSPGTKTPSLVARLMGLDLLPELSSPRPSSSSNHSTTPNPPSKSSSSHHCRSLPETPRISMARRSDSDNYHHRHSLQANKENIFTSEELSKWPDVQRLSSYLNAKLDTRREFNRNEEDSKKSSLYAKQIVKQVKENISRRVGTDITNTTMAKKKEHRRDEHLVLLKSKKAMTRMGGQDESTLSCSPRLRLLEVKNKPVSVPSSATKSQNLVSQKFQVAPLKEKENKPKQLDAKKSKKITSERYDVRSKRSAQTIRNKQEEPFIRSPSTSKVKLSDKKCRKTPLSNNIVNISAPKFLSFKKKDLSPSSTPLLSKNQVSLESSTQLSRNQSLSYILKAQNNCSADNSNGAIPTNTTSTTTGDVDYISRLLRHNGIDKTTPISIKQWYYPSHPLHPSIFHHLHNSTTTTTTNTSRLIFDLVDELLVEILKPYMNFRPWVITPIRQKTQMCGRELINILSKKIGSFPGVDCRVLEDIDALIDGDQCMSIKLQKSVAFEEEGEGIVTELERDIVDTLVHEMAMMMWQGRTI